MKIYIKIIMNELIFPDLLQNNPVVGGRGGVSENIIGHQLTMLDDVNIGSSTLLSLIL